MKTQKIITVMCSLLVAIVFVTKAQAQNGTDTLKLKADVTCQSCKNKIEKNMAYEKGVTMVNADIDKDIVTVVYKLDKTNPDALSAALTKIGYTNQIIAQNGTKHCTQAKANCQKQCKDVKKCPQKANYPASAQSNCCKKGDVKKACCAKDSSHCPKKQ